MFKTSIVQGRSSGLRALRVRSQNISQLASDKKLLVSWDNRGTHYLISLKTLANQRVWDKVVFVKGLSTVKMINHFYDIFEEELERR